LHGGCSLSVCAVRDCFSGPNEHWSGGSADAAELGFSPSVIGFGAGIFFLGYFLLEIPVH